MAANVLLILAIVALGAVLANQGMALSMAVKEAHARTKAVREQSERLQQAIENFKKECDHIEKEMAETGAGMGALRQSHDEARVRLTDAAGRTRRRLMILSDRRGPHDLEWIVTVTNTRIGEVDSSNPLAAEWAKGRLYLVWAESDRDAGERAARRFSARPGYAVKSVEQVTENLYPARPAILTG